MAKSATERLYQVERLFAQTRLDSTDLNKQAFLAISLGYERSKKLAPGHFVRGSFGFE